MRPMVVVPAHEMAKFSAHFHVSERNQDAARAVALQSSEEPLDDGYAAMLAHRAVARLDSSPPTPASVSSRHEHAFLIAQQVARRRPDVPDRTTEESAQRSSIRLVSEDHPPLNSAGVVIQDNNDPPAEGPLLRQRMRAPGSPEAEPCRNSTQIDMPEFVCSSCLDSRPSMGRDAAHPGVLDPQLLRRSRGPGGRSGSATGPDDSYSGRPWPAGP
jgi:hypothetical protein